MLPVIMLTYHMQEAAAIGSDCAAAVLRQATQGCTAHLNPKASRHLIQYLVLIKMLFSLPAGLIGVSYSLS